MSAFMFQRALELPRIIISLIIITFSQHKQYMSQRFLPQTTNQNNPCQQLATHERFHQNIHTFRRRMSREGRWRVDQREREDSIPRSQFQSSLWRLPQNISYMHFLLQNEELFRGSRNDRKASKINVLMSAAVGTRSPDQCRSHHQKMIKYHQDIPNIVKHIRNLALTQQNLNEPSPASLAPPLPIPSETPPLPKTTEKVMESPSTIFDWDSWVLLNEKAWEERMNEQWLSGVEDIYGNI